MKIECSIIGPNNFVINFQMEKRGLKTTGFPDTDRELLQKAFDEEFKSDLEIARARRLELKKRAIHQANLKRRRLLMERTVLEEQEELSRNYQVSMRIDLVRENETCSSVKIDVNSVSARALAKAMWVNVTITCLDLSSQQLNDHAGSYLARILKRNNTLRKLELDNNDLGPKTCAAFGESLRMNTSLSYLSLDSNPLSNGGSDYSGISVLVDAVGASITLRSINLWRTGLGQQGGFSLANAIERNDTLLFCDIGHNSIDMCDVKRIVTKLDNNLAAYEQSERRRRDDEVVLAEKRKTVEDAENVIRILYSCRDMMFHLGMIGSSGKAAAERARSVAGIQSR